MEGGRDEVVRHGGVQDAAEVADQEQGQHTYRNVCHVGLREPRQVLCRAAPGSRHNSEAVGPSGACVICA